MQEALSQERTPTRPKTHITNAGGFMAGVTVDPVNRAAPAKAASLVLSRRQGTDDTSQIIADHVSLASDLVESFTRQTAR